MQLPREPRAGDPLDGAWGAQVVRFLRSITPRSGPGVLVRQGAGGSVFEAAPGGKAQTVLHPFHVSNASGGGDAKVRVRFGQVNSLTPTIDEVPLNAAEPPELEVVTGVVYLRVELDVDGIATAATIANAAELPDDTATYAHITLATVTVAGGAVTAIHQAVTHSLMVRRCGVAEMHFWGV